MPYPYNYYPQNQQFANSQQFIPQTQQLQSPFVMVRSEAEARNYPVGFGNVVMFKDENSPYIYTKTMGFSQSEKPIFDKYKKEGVDTPEEPKNDGLKEQIGDLNSQITSLWKEINFLKERKKARNDEHSSNGKSN